MNTVAAILALLLTITVPLTSIFAAAALPPRYPADTPEGFPPLFVAMPPKLMVPNEFTVASASTPAAIAVASFTALIPLLPELIISAPEVMTEIFPGPHAAAPMP